MAAHLAPAVKLALFGGFGAAVVAAAIAFEVLRVWLRRATLADPGLGRSYPGAPMRRGDEGDGGNGGWDWIGDGCDGGGD